jgi:hypothetical protein
VQTIKNKGSIITLEAYAAINLLKEKFMEIVSLNHFIEGQPTRLNISRYLR